MSRRGIVTRLSPLVLAVLVLAGHLNGQDFLNELQMEHDPGRRSEKALGIAETEFDAARSFYTKGDIHGGDAHLEDMTNVLKQCLGSLGEANKARYYKKAELHVAALQRRLKGLVDDLNLEERGWAEYTQRKIDEIHDLLLSGVMRK